MARQCPDSYYFGRAVLSDHYWYIDQRGIANIVPRSGFTVHGLVYEVSADDEIHLDRSKSVRDGVVSKVYKRVSLYEASEPLQMHTRWLVKDGGPEQVIKAAQQGLIATRERRESVLEEVLVYMSTGFFSQNGPVRDGYIDQMNSGIRDGISLGIPVEYFENTVRRWIPKRETLHASSQRRNRHLTTHSRGPVLSTSRSSGSSGSRRSTRKLINSASGEGRKHHATHVTIEVSSR